ncbi:MAG: BMC domain-containing protein [Clostridium sp.]|nr:BMC domain-containing protein [Clostridium sp.]
MDIKDLIPEDSEGRLRIIQESVPGKQISLAHIIGGPRPIVYKKLGLNPEVDFGNSAIGILNITPPESAVIASDIAIKSSDVYLGFVDRFSGTLIITGALSEVDTAIEEIVSYFTRELEFASCKITRR